jgi:hypothetical protein
MPRSVLVGASQRKRPLGRAKLRRNDNIEKDFQEVGWVEWTGLILLGIGTHGRQ